jgi:hypothetical protein
MISKTYFHGKLPPTRLQPKPQLSCELSRFVMFGWSKKRNEINGHNQDNCRQELAGQLAPVASCPAGLLLNLAS